MAKLLFVSNISSSVGSFAVASIAAAKKSGFEFYYASNWGAATTEQIEEDEKKYDIKLVHIDFDRSPYSVMNIRAYNQLVDFIKRENIDFIHCNTPVGGLLGRLAGEKCNVKKVLYQVHGFHFYDGAPKRNWKIYYPVEKWLAKKTDVIITINKEDFKRAKGFKLRDNGNVYYVPGVGIDLSKYKRNEHIAIIKRKELGFKNTDTVIISVGELNANKNNKIIIEALSKMDKRDIHYCICGEGALEKELMELAKSKKIEKQVHFLGYRNDINELLQAADIYVMPSIREGLSRSLMEAMASGVPCVVSKIRGNTDLISHGINGFLCTSIDEYIDSITEVMQSSDCAELFVKRSLNKLKEFSIEKVEDCIFDIYSREFR